MNRQIRYHSRPLSLSRHLLGIVLCLGICTVTQAAGYSSGLDTQTRNTMIQYSSAPDITCGKQPGQRPVSMNIRGADVAALWRSAYHMLFPASSLSDNGKVISRAAMVPHKGPSWGISISKRTAIMSVQTKW